MQLSAKRFCRPERVRVTGPGLVSCKYVPLPQPLEQLAWDERVDFATIRQKSYLDVERFDAGPGEFRVHISDKRDERARVPFEVEYFDEPERATRKLGFLRVSSSARVFRLLYYPPRTGSYELHLTLDGRPIRCSPFTMQVATTLDQINVRDFADASLLAALLAGARQCASPPLPLLHICLVLLVLPALLCSTPPVTPASTTSSTWFRSLAMDPGICRVRGRGVQPCGLRVAHDSLASFVVDTSGAGDGDLECSLVNRGERHAHDTSASTRPLLNAYDVPRRWKGAAR